MERGQTGIAGGAVALVIEGVSERHGEMSPAAWDYARKYIEHLEGPARRPQRPVDVSSEVGTAIRHAAEEYAVEWAARLPG